MTTPRDIRRLAFQVLYQLDARGERDAEDILKGLEGAEEYGPADRRKAFELAQAAYGDRARADELMTALAPSWPVHRQAPVDRAILRLAHFEITSGRVNAKIAINEAVELAKAFSTEKSPGFVNALLDKVQKQTEAEETPAEPPPTGETPAEGSQEL
ncbi:MAG: transcription antitermination factor NusB [Phycisphaerales bacterium]|nr:transcription antitermination factor NusB [Phycisphaerales bacterium]